MNQFDWIEYDLVAFAFQSTNNLWLPDLLNYAVICSIMFFLGSGGGGGGGGGGACPIRELIF